MADYKFDRFYYLDDDSNDHYLSEIEKLSDDDYNAHFKGRIYCPLCKKVQLSRVITDKSVFLRTYPNQPHGLVDGDNCMYECDTASKQLVEKFITELRQKNKIKSLLKSTLRTLFKVKGSKDSGEGSSTEKKTPLLIDRKKEDGSIERKIIPHYSFYSWGPNIPQDRLMVIYGKVYIRLVQTKSKDNNEEDTSYKPQTYIHFCNIKNKKLITSCFKPDNLEISEGNYAVAILGKCVQNGKYFNIWINSPISDSIEFQELD